MKGILIDPFTKTVKDVETPDGDTEAWKKLINVQWITAVTIAYDDLTGWRETIWLDDEGLYVEDQKFFKWDGYDQPLAGKGIIFATDDEGDTVSTHLSAKHVRHKITWPDIELDHMEPVPEGTTVKSALFGGEEIPVVGSTAVFRSKSKTYTPADDPFPEDESD